MYQLRRFGHNDIHWLTDSIESERMMRLWTGPSFTYPLTCEQFEEHLSRLEVQPLLFSVDGENAGYIELFRINKLEYRLCRVLIAPAFRAKGLSKPLVQLAIDFAKDELKIKRVSLAVFTHNKAAVACYQRIGFKKYQKAEMRKMIDGEYWEMIKMKIKF